MTIVDFNTDISRLMTQSSPALRRLPSVRLDRLLILLERFDTFRHAIRQQSLLINQDGSLFHNSLPCRSTRDPLMPSLDVGKSFELLLWRASKKYIDAIIPGGEGEVSKSDLVAYEPLFPLQCTI